MVNDENSWSAPAPIGDPQGELPGIPQGSSLNQILAAYGLACLEAPDGLRRYRHDLLCGDLRAIAEVWITPDGIVDAFRIRSLRRTASPKTSA